MLSMLEEALPASVGAAREDAGLSSPETFAQMLQRGYRRYPYRPLLICEDEVLTYAAAYNKAVVLADYLLAVCGIGPGCSVVLAVPNLVSFPYIVAGVQLTGACLVQVSPDLLIDDFRQRMDVANPTVLIMSSNEQCEMAKALLPHAHVMIVGRGGSRFASVESVVSSMASDLRCDPEGIDRDTSVMLFSSGSTGKPKAIVNRASSFARNARVLCQSLMAGSDDVLFLPVPFAHVFGIVGLYVTLTAGMTAVTAGKYRPETALSLISEMRATLYFGVPTMFLRELRENQFDEWDISSLRAGLVAGAGCPASVIVEYERRWSCRLFQSYGMTETAATLTMPRYDDPVDVRSRGVGWPIPGVEMKLDGQANEILCKSESVMEGVIDERGALALELDEEGWFHTGDVGAFDARAGYSVVGRIKDMVLRGGVNIFPAEVERVFDAGGLVSECVLVGYPDDELGERSCLCVVLADGVSMSAYEVRQYAVGRIEKCKVPDTVLLMDRFPHLANGKIDKTQLKKDVLRALAPKARRHDGR